MNTNEKEMEVKFFLTDLAKFENRLVAAGAQKIQTRIFEKNLRFDTFDLALTQAHCVLRLRQDERIRLTYKGSALAGQSVGIRQEIEFEVSSFEAARHFLEALGYQVSMVYEKYRTTYALGLVEVMLDEMPYGSFAEIEGSSPDDILSAARFLDLDWEARCTVSYMELFAQLKERRGLQVKHLTFDELSGLSFSAEDFNLKPADQK
jgi:adenylate cyclase, class 2